MKSHRRLRGFTLIEILVAVTIIAVALGAIVRGLAMYASNAGYLRQKTLATWVAHDRLTEIELEPPWPAEGKSDGDADMGGFKWRWFVEVKKTPDEHLRRIDIRVQLPGKELDIASMSAFISDTGRQ
ncbi:MAG TPA: type II secretion system minor pseudopilin GspI [Nevskiaceae bacterium]|nr:type II secretion system minor pseudopilin GspI [Nevskiaceae bacterium]